MTRSKDKRATAEPSTDEDSNTKEETLKSTSAPLTSCASVCIALAIVGVVMQWWWPLPILLFIGLMFQGYEDTVAAKANSGYPGLEVGDAMAIAFVGGQLFIFCCVLFWGSFYLPTEGWEKIFSGPGAEAAQGVIEADGDA
ncbi:hypothetical protein N8739_01425 [Luminiphilus sp.]|nr:hypothetical protein [Luminiphilus sp.]